MCALLYRGVNAQLHAAFDGYLRPKANFAFVRAAEWGTAEWGNAFWGENVENAVVWHQQHQAGYPTSGVSTTPHKERARFYATRGGVDSVGFIYIINRERLSAFGVSAYDVNKIVPMPSVPEDEEVILVARDFGSLPREIVVEVVECKTSA